jgi:hypothetical protein
VASSSVDPAILRVARRVARDAVASGARAVVLTGSHARGDANASSDIDIIVVHARMPAERDWLPVQQHRFGHLVTVSTATAAGVRAAFRTPRDATTHVPGWRDAFVLHDPDGVAARLVRAAQRWTWEGIAPACDDYVADELTGYAEEVHKLVAAIERRRWMAAAVWRDVFATRLAHVMAIHRRTLFGTENVLWDVVCDALGAEWREAQSAALSLGGEPTARSCRGALRLYALAAREARSLFDARQRRIVAHACALAGFPLD